MSAKREHNRLRAAVLTYHTIDDSGSVLATAPRLFAEQMGILARSGVQVVPLAEIPRLLTAKPGGAPAVALTFDDGFMSVYEHALPALGRYRFPATVFVVSDYCGRTNSWPSQPAHLAGQRLLGWDQLREMIHEGLAAGCHTGTHPDLRHLPSRDRLEEVAGAKSRIEDALGVPVSSFAYPYGSFDPEIRALVGAHFSLACTTTLGFVAHDSDPFALERLDMYYLRTTALLARLFAPSVGGYIRLRRIFRDLRAHASVSRFVD
jgi:peptidoglycan/xylan/chitin deacetylase (PgdA/CDA1 family)